MIDCDVNLGKRLKILEASKWETTGAGRSQEEKGQEGSGGMRGKDRRREGGKSNEIRGT